MIAGIVGSCLACSSNNGSTGNTTATPSGNGSAGNTTATHSVHGSSVLVATTTSLYDTGLWTYLTPIFEREYPNMTLHVTEQGSGAAINLSETGDADVLAVHSKAAELQFVAAGYGVKRIPFAYNYFIIVGPASDPAGIKGMNATNAFKQIASQNASFASRGDNSGTNTKEIALWKAAGVNYSEIQTAPWYISTGQGMGATLLIASEKGTYTLSDKGTYLSYASNLSLVTLVDNTTDLLNVYSVIAVNSSKFPWINTAGANDLIEFMTSNETQQLIGNFGVEQYGQSLFYPCAGNEPTQ